MCGDGDAAKAVDVLDDIAPLTGQRVWRFRQSERHDVAVSGADLNAVNVQHAIAIVRQIGRACGVAMVGDDYELQAGPRGRSEHFVNGSGAVRPVRMNVHDATNGRLQAFAWWRQTARSSRKGSEEHESSRGDNRQTTDQPKHASQALG